jgi:hypothetical protein
MNESSGGNGGAGNDVAARIQTRLDEIARPDYDDPARTDLTGLDWLVFFGFLLVCAVGAVLWGY